MNKIFVIGIIGAGVIAGVAITLSILKSKSSDTFETSARVKKNTDQSVNTTNVDFEEVVSERNDIASDISSRHKEAERVIRESVSEFTDENNVEIKGDHEDELDKMIDDINSI